MNISMQLVVVAAAACLCLAQASPDVRLSRKQQRPTRGFKNVEMMTARGFGKRDHPVQRAEHQQFYTPVRRKFNPKSSLMVAENFGKRSENTDDTVDEVYDLDNFWETLEATAEKENLDFLDEKESIPLDWFVNEMINNPDFARTVVRKFIDVNQDGMLSSNELLRNPA